MKVQHAASNSKQPPQDLGRRCISHLLNTQPNLNQWFVQKSLFAPTGSSKSQATTRARSKAITRAHLKQASKQGTQAGWVLLLPLTLNDEPDGEEDFGAGGNLAFVHSGVPEGHRTHLQGPLLTSFGVVNLQEEEEEGRDGSCEGCSSCCDNGCDDGRGRDTGYGR